MVVQRDPVRVRPRSGVDVVRRSGAFIYIALADLVPQITDRPSLVEKVTQTASFLAGLGLLLATAILPTTSAAG